MQRPLVLIHVPVLALTSHLRGLPSAGLHLATGHMVPANKIVGLALLVGAACSSPPSQAVSLLGYDTSAPSAWEARAPGSSMRLTEFDVGGGAEVIVFYFGVGQGGSAAANIARWESQFTAPDGGPVQAEVSTLEGSTFPTTIAELEGRYARGVGMGAQGEAEDDQALMAAVVETPQGTLFPQLVGPRAAVDAEREAFLDFVRGIAPTRTET